MASLVVAGDTSGSITLAAPAVAGSNTLTLPANTGTVITTASSGQSIPKAALPTGSVLQVVNATTSTQVEASYSSATDLGLSASITPTSSSSKILVLVSANGCGARGSTIWTMSLVRGSTTIYYFQNYIGENVSTAHQSLSTSYLDSPATTSSTTYKLQGLRNSGTNNCYFNISAGGATGTTSTITLLEIAA